MELIDRPMYRHTSECCQFLGQFATFDLYFCSDKNSSVILCRGSDEENDYRIVDIKNEHKRSKDLIFLEGARRAKLKGLPCMKS